MNVKLHAALLAMLVLANAPAFGQDYEIVLDPENPTTRDEIRISVIDSECWGPTYYEEDLERRLIRIRLAYGFVPHGEECSDEYPYSDGYSRVIGPLAAGDYRVEVMLTFGGITPAGSIRLSQTFSVTQAPPAELLSVGGITGLYYNPQEDGHYISILQTDYNTLVIWNTFDAAGHLRWVYGVGDLQNGKSVIAQTYINESDGFSGGGLDGFQAEPWGTMQVTLDNCHLGTFTYDSLLSEYGTGQFPIKRLAFSKQLGCEEVDQSE